MLPLNSILQAVKATVEARFPGELCHLNVVPTKFDRPAFLAELVKTSLQDANLGLLQMTVSIKVTAFVEVDAYYNSQVEDLARRLTSLQELFCGCAIQVEDRHIHFGKSQGVIPGLDFAECTIEATYMDQRPNSIEEWPLMKTVQTVVSAEPAS